MSPHLTTLAESPDAMKAVRAVSRADVIDAAARVITRRGDHRMRWAAIAYEAGNAQAVLASQWFEDLPALIDECYARTAQGLSDSLLRAETAPGTALDRLAAFLVAALEIRRARGAFLSFRRGGDLPVPLQRRLHEHDTTARMRLKRLLNKGRRDGSLALRNLDSAVELLLASLQVPTVVVDGPEQRMWDSELVELLLAALSEPHPPEAEPVRSIAVMHGSCLCGSVRYEVQGPFEVMSHCQCSICRRQRGTASATLMSVPLAGFSWLSGEAAISTYHSSDYGRRTFCSKCGSATPVVEAETGVVLCPPGSLDGEAGIRSAAPGFVPATWPAFRRPR
ncbi:MAG TPA: GFA family protein [Steroidobacteraceae bacterium]|nr:GFA family protein [Steroidobacteraceae bacterium]